MTVVSVIALYGPGVRAMAQARQDYAAAQVIRAVQAELQRLPFSTVSSYLSGADSLYTSQSGGRVGPRGSPVWSDLDGTQREQDREKYFEIALIRNESLTPAAGALIFTLRLRWPAFTGNGQRLVDHAQQKMLLVPAAVAR
ncbi:MAG: hypothetical protein EXS39_07790 [Opitutaceae bacterium]|nr:hypothetical protein [Opitutaceae bacterium]